MENDEGLPTVVGARSEALASFWYEAARRDAAAMRASILLHTKPPSARRTQMAALRLSSRTTIATSFDGIDFP
jgi:hypothetical protein